MKRFCQKGEKRFQSGEKEVYNMNNITLPHNHNISPVSKNIQKELDNIDKFQLIADIFKQLGDTTRVRLFWLLCHCEECVLNISAMMKMTSPAISHHLRALRNKGLVSSRRVGKEVYYKSSNTEESILLHKMIERILMITCPEYKE